MEERKKKKKKKKKMKNQKKGGRERLDFFSPLLQKRIEILTIITTKSIDDIIRSTNVEGKRKKASSFAVSPIALP